MCVNVNKIISLSVLILIFSFRFIIAATADTIYLKNGRSIEGLIKNEDQDFVELEVYGGSVKFRKSAIERTEKSPPEEAQAMRQGWERKKIETQNMMLKRQLEEERQPKKVEFSQESQHIMLDVKLNKKIDASLVLDTGASLVVLNKDIAKKLGVDLDKFKPDVKLILADSRQIDAKFIVLESVKVGNVEAKDVEAAIMLEETGDPGFGDGLLGMSFLKRFNFKIDQKNNKLILEKL